ncbi:hypothetical protein V6N13_132962 [Hibiscus sabdariffa]
MRNPSTSPVCILADIFHGDCRRWRSSRLWRLCHGNHRTGGGAADFRNRNHDYPICSVTDCRERRGEMEEVKGVVKHIVMVKFKDETTTDKIEELIKGYANLVNLIPPMKAFHWGKDVSAENLHQGFTHVFESTFESTQGVAEYVAHPAHVDFANLFLSYSDKIIIFDYKPTIVRC